MMDSASKKLVDSKSCMENVKESAPCMGNDFQLHIRPIIDLIDKLRRLGVEKDVSLPSIVVVGDQSSGKSSVLEALSGVQLPRGSGIVTRCPLELQMRSGEGEWSGQIEYKKDRNVLLDAEGEDGSIGMQVVEKINDPTEVEKHVRKAQDVLAGPDKRVSKSLIRLTIKSRDVPDLTLIDLPGITRIATSGQQEDTSDIIRQTIESYIKQKHTIILAVIPANADIATSEALQMAKKEDEQFKRTIGVVTKPDLVDKGGEEELIQVITNERYHLTLGYTLVKCRSQNAINNSKTLLESLREEENFFNNNKHFEDVPKKLLGVKNLSRKLTEVLVLHIKEHLPGLKKNIGDLIESTNAELQSLGEGLPTDQMDLRRHFFKELQDFSEKIGNMVKGEVSINGQIISDLNPYVKLRNLFNEYATDINKMLPGKDDAIFIYTLQETMKTKRGNELPRFMSYKVFEDQIKELVGQFLEPARKCLNEACKQLEFIFNELVKLTIGKYDCLSENIQECICEQIRESKAVCDAELVKHFEMEALVYTQDKTYIAAHDDNQNVVTTDIYGRPIKIARSSSNQPDFIFDRGDEVLDEHLRQDAGIMFDKIIAYMHVSMQRVADVVPMTILFFMVNRLTGKIKDNILKLTDKPEDAARLLSESPNIAERRTSARKKLERLMLAYEEIKKSGTLPA